MASITSRTTTERAVRVAMATALVTVFAVWFLWDGHVGYARSNARLLAESLGTSFEREPALDGRLTRRRADQLIREIQPGLDQATLAARLGEPGLRHRDECYYLGPGGHLRIKLEQGRVHAVQWADGRHSDTDIAWRHWIGYALLAGALAAIVHLLRVLVMRVSVTPGGLKMTGRPLIPFDAITLVRRVDARGAVGVRVGYSCAGRSRSVVLDDYRIRDLGAIVDALCERTGLPNPVQGQGVGAGGAHGDHSPE